MKRDELIITLDGPAGSGKTTLARELALVGGGVGFSSGILYRWLGLIARRQNLDLPKWTPEQFSFRQDGPDLVTLFDGEQPPRDLQQSEIAQAASVVAADPDVRSRLLDVQRNVKIRPLIADGRDMGTVVFPGAPVKYYIIASPAERASRRAADLGITDADKIIALEKEIETRDRRDRERPISPLAAAQGSITIDTTADTIAETTAIMVQFIVDIFPDFLKQ